MKDRTAESGREELEERKNGWREGLKDEMIKKGKGGNEREEEWLEKAE